MKKKSFVNIVMVIIVAILVCTVVLFAIEHHNVSETLGDSKVHTAEPVKDK